MKTKVTFLGLLSFLILSGTVNAQKIEERDYYKNNPQLGGEITIESSTNEVIDNESYTNFSIVAPSEGDYFMNFWLMPAKHKDETYSTYKVLVNGIFAGNIVPRKGNWQTIGLSNNRRVKLNLGNNTISIVAQMPEVPAVEFVRLSKNSLNAYIPSEKFDNYLNQSMKAAGNRPAMVVNKLSLDGDTLGNISTRSSGTSVWNGISLGYTFYTKLMFYAGQEIFITSASNSLHIMEFFNANMPQYLSWSHFSEYAVNGGKNYLATVRVTIPQDGYYYIRARTYYNCTGGTADINVNGTYYYANAPIYTSGVVKYQGGNGNYYSSFTRNATTDPVMWIQGQAERIVAYNDDANTSYAAPHGVSGLNSFIRENYSMSTCAVLVTTYGSYNGSGTCSIYAGVPDGVSTRSMPLNDPVEVKSATSNTQIEFSQTTVYPNPAKLNSQINISYRDLIERVDVYNLSGQKLQSLVINEKQAQLPLSGMNISKTGVYILSIKTTSGIKTEKIVVN